MSECYVFPKKLPKTVLNILVLGFLEESKFSKRKCPLKVKMA